MIKDITEEDLFHYENEDLDNTNLQGDNVEIEVLDLLFSDDKDVIVQPVLNNKIIEKEYDGLAQYSIAIRNIPQCQPEESIELAKQFLEGSITAKDRLIKGNLRLVLYIAFKYQTLAGELDVQDLISEGYIGLAKAAEKFDVNQGSGFASYAQFWIRQYIRRFISNNRETVRVPVQSYDKILELEKHKKKFKELSDDEVLEKIKDTKLYSERYLNSFYYSLSKKYSLNSYYTINNKKYPLMNYLKEKLVDYNTPLDICCQNDTYYKENILSYGNLTEREDTIMKMRFGLDEYNASTLEEISLTVGRTRERVRQLTNSVFKKIKIRILTEDPSFYIAEKRYLELCKEKDIEYNILKNKHEIGLKNLESKILEEIKFFGSRWHFKKALERLEKNKKKVFYSPIPEKNYISKLYSEGYGRLKDSILDKPNFHITENHFDSISNNSISESEIFHKVIDILELNPYLTKGEIIEELENLYPKRKFDTQSIKKVLKSSLIEKRKSLFCLRSSQIIKREAKAYSDEDILDDIWKLKDKINDIKEIDIIQPLTKNKNELKNDMDNDLLDLFFEDEKNYKTDKKENESTVEICEPIAEYKINDNETDDETDELLEMFLI